MPELLATREELEALIRRSGFVSHYAFHLHSFAASEATIVIPYNPLYDRPGGMVSGPVYMAAGAFAVWLAVMTRLGVAVGEQSLLMEFKTNFLSSVRTQSFRCTGRVLKLGASLIFGTAECVTEQDKVLAHHSMSYTNPKNF